MARTGINAVPRVAQITGVASGSGTTCAHHRPMLASLPAGRNGTQDETAAAVRFLASEEAGYITGSAIDVSGGARMQ